MKTNNQKLQSVIIVAGFFLFLTFIPAQANLKQIKLYKEAFPDAKPKCIQCHVDEKPKKDDGQHEPNDYGKEVLKTDKEPTADTYKKVGVVENFKKN